MFEFICKKIGLKFSMNDPQWGRGSGGNDQNGRKPNDGPPDLDQLWRDFNKRFGKILSGKGGSGGSGGSGGGGLSFPGGGKSTGISIIVVVIISFFLWIVSGFFIIQEGQTGVVLTFGKYSYSTQPGFNWRWPFPIQSHETVNISQVRTVEVGYRNNVRNKVGRESLMLTDDENIIDIQFAVQYRLKNASDWVFNNRDREQSVKQVAETSIREIVGKSKMDFVLYEGREQIALDTQSLMQQILDSYNIGVLVFQVTMQGVQPPEQVQAAFDDAVKAGQDKERQKNEGQAYANDIVPRAKGSASRLLQESEGYKSKVVASAEGEASRFTKILTEYNKAPKVTRDRMYLDVMQEIFSTTTKIMVDTKANNSMIYLPLDKLLRQTTETSNQSSNQPSSSQSSISESARARDLRTLREREAR